MFKYVILILILSHVHKTLQQKSLKDFPEECFTASQIDDDSRVFDNYKIPTSTADDLNLAKGWYRFTGRLANSIKQGFGGPLPGNKNNAPNFCGTTYPGTLMGTHPTVEEGIVSMLVCFREKYCFYEKVTACQCKRKKIIYVRNCKRHYIYWLVPTGRFERYCTSKTWLNKPITSNISSDAIECSQYKTISDPSRVWDREWDVTPETEEGWVRFDKSTGNSMASTCTPQSPIKTRSLRKACGAKFRGWMIERHPSVLEGRLQRPVCFSYAHQCKCEFYTSIGVRNCGDYFVYRLHKPPIDDSRYCGETTTTVSPPVTTVTPNETEPRSGVARSRFDGDSICNMSTVRYDVDRLWSNTNPTVYKCDANLYGMYEFTSGVGLLSMKESCNKTDMRVIAHRCGTLYQGFLEGRHPTVSEGYVEKIVCFQQNFVPCECYFTTVIGVQNCGDKYVYDLRGVPTCNARFCMTLHGNADTVIDTSAPSLYGIPTNYEPREEPSTAESSADDINEGLQITNMMLGIILVLLFIMLIVVVIVILLVVRPLYKQKTQT